MCLLYEKIALEIESRINSGLYILNSRIPSETTLAKELSVSRPTVKGAVKLLEKKGILHCRPAVGSFVVKKPNARTVVAYIAPNLSDPFHAEAVRELDFAARKYNTGLFVTQGGNDRIQEEEAVHRAIKSGAAGIIFCSHLEESFSFTKYDVPFIRFAPGDSKHLSDHVCLDNRLGIREILAHLESVGCATVGYAQVSYEESVPDVRKNFVLEYISENSKLRTEDKWIIHSRLDGEAGGLEIMDRFVECDALPDAIVCYNDWTAIGLMKKAIEIGIRIPDDLKITGFDNLFLSRYLEVPLTTYDYHLHHMADNAIRMITEKIQDPEKDPEQLCITGELIIRESTCK